jgi:hypothetical protein
VNFARRLAERRIVQSSALRFTQCSPHLDSHRVEMQRTLNDRAVIDQLRWWVTGLQGVDAAPASHDAGVQRMRPCVRTFGNPMAGAGRGYGVPPWTLLPWSSIVALGCAIVSAVLSGAQAHSARSAVNLAEKRQHKERTPTFAAKVEDVNGDGLFLRLRVMLTSDEELQAFEVRLPRACSFAFVEHLLGVDASDLAHSPTLSVVPHALNTAWPIEPTMAVRRDIEWVSIRAKGLRRGGVDGKRAGRASAGAADHRIGG